MLIAAHQSLWERIHRLYRVNVWDAADRAEHFIGSARTVRSFLAFADIGSRWNRWGFFLRYRPFEQPIPSLNLESADQVVAAPCWAVALLAALLPFFRVRRWLRRRRRFAAHLCRHCGYDLTGNVSGICPECGMPSLSNT